VQASARVGRPIGRLVPERLQILIDLEGPWCGGGKHQRSPLLPIALLWMQERYERRKVDMCCPMRLVRSPSKLSLERPHFGQGPRLQPGSARYLGLSRRYQFGVEACQ
jgi:hypothetical protein